MKRPIIRLASLSLSAALAVSLCLALCFAVVLWSALTHSRGVSSKGAVADYQVPSSLIDLLELQPTPRGSVSPSGVWLAVEEEDVIHSSDLRTPSLRLAGIRVNPITGNPLIAGTTATQKNRQISLVRIADGARFAIHHLPVSNMSDVLWAPDGRRFAFLHFTLAGAELWIADVQRLQASILPGAPINEAGPPIRQGPVDCLLACPWLR